jgi:Predicted P-loop-containing kinase
LPADADIVFDVRFVPNPFWIESMRKKTGEDAEVIEYVMGFPQTNDFLDQFSAQIRTLLPYYQMEGKNRLTMAIGCTGGQHRSVCMSDRLAERLTMDGVATIVSHRDLALADRG